jgi:Fe-S-cluster containining protein
MFVNIEKLTDLRFNNCKNCNKCCEDKFFLAPLILDDFEEVYEYFEIYFIKIENFIKVVMILTDGEICKYLKDGKCTIYDNRPPACRIYPYSPYFDEIRLDISCDSVGLEGDKLILKKSEFKNSKFFHKRFLNIEDKVLKTDKFLEQYKDKLKYKKELKGIKLYTIDDNNEYIQMHQNSIK